MKVEELEAELKALKKQVRTLQDIEEIKILQRSYGYYYEHWMTQEVVDLFADGPDTTIHWLAQGTFVGKGKIKKLYDLVVANMDPKSLHALILSSGIVHVDPDGKTAKGRWYGVGIYALGGPHNMGISLYEVEYVKQNGKWKIKMLEHGPVYWSAKLEKIETIAVPAGAKDHFDTLPFDIRNKLFNPNYPSGYIRPFHFKHPVTGKKTSEGARNAPLEIMKYK
jgi:hypothetical protein